MLIITTFEIAGWRIERACAEVFGLTVRSRNAFSQLGAAFQSLGGGELHGIRRT